MSSTILGHEASPAERRELWDCCAQRDPGGARALLPGRARGLLLGRGELLVTREADELQTALGLPGPPQPLAAHAVGDLGKHAERVSDQNNLKDTENYLERS